MVLLCVFHINALAESKLTHTINCLLGLIKSKVNMMKSFYYISALNELFQNSLMDIVIILLTVIIWATLMIASPNHSPDI